MLDCKDITEYNEEHHYHVTQHLHVAAYDTTLHESESFELRQQIIEDQVYILGI